MKKALLLFLLLSILNFMFVTALATAQNGGTPSVMESEPVANSGDGTSADSQTIPGKVMVLYKDGKQSLSTDSTSQARASGWGSIRATRPNSIGVGTVQFSTGSPVDEMVQLLEQDPNVEYVEPVYPVKMAEASGLTKSFSGPAASSVASSVYTPNDPKYTDQWGLAAINFEESRQYVSADDLDDVVIAVLDTGVDLGHADFAPSLLLPGYDFVNSDNNPQDDHGHGTHVAGLAAAVANNGIGIAGVAGGAKILPVKVLNAAGEGTSDDIVDGIDWAVGHGADVINLSLGMGVPSVIVELAVDNAVRNGVIVIAASGNESNHWVTGENGDLDITANPVRYANPVAYPAAYANAVAVGAADWYSALSTNGDEGFIVADFSNTGPELDVVAPGVAILSTMLPNTYESLSGTSMATPLVSGLAALVLAGDSSLRADATEERVNRVRSVIQETPLDLGTAGLDSTFGYGLIDLQEAFEKPRIVFQDEWVDNQEAETLSMSVTVATYSGSLMDINGDAIFQKSLWNSENETWIENTSVTFAVYSGQGTFEYNYSSAEPGVYRMKAVESVGAWVSDTLFLLNPPGSPTANLQSGTYTGTQSVTLSSANPGAVIYYTMNGTVPSPASSVYSGSIPIASSLTLKAVAVKNGVSSEVTTFNYVINPVVSPPPVVSQPPVISPPPVLLPSPVTGLPPTADDDGPKPEVKEEDGLQTLNIQYTLENLKTQLEDAKVDTVTLDARQENGEGQLDRFVLDFPAELTGEESRKPLLIRTNDADFQFKPGSVQAADGAKEFKLTVTRSGTSDQGLSQTASGARFVSQVLDFELTADGKKVNEFANLVTVTVSFDSALVGQSSKLGAYREDPVSGQWVYLGGKPAGDGKWSFETPHFSRYAVMEYDKTFADITGHWAQGDVELLASKYIVNGIDDTRFAPDAGVTRAEFAALLVRALALPASESAPLQFDDLSEKAWYYDAVSRAYGAGLIDGYTESRFGPNDPVNREQMASMLVRAYALSIGKSGGDFAVTQDVKFTDEGHVSQWARSDVRAAYALQLMLGLPDGRFVPDKGATRAESAVAVKRMIDKIGQN